MSKVGKSLVDHLKLSAREWREQGYPCDDYPLIGFILQFQSEIQGDQLTLKYLREPQFFALEIYWYVRLKLKSPKVIDLYKHYYGSDKVEFLDAVGVPLSSDALDYVEIDNIIQRVQSDQEFVDNKKLQTLHEAVILDYPSYILALAMGAGKTVLIGAIIATEFAMSLRYPSSEFKFMKNALVFAPGTTIIESLRELSEIPYEKILPPNSNRDFLANLKIEYADKGKDLQVQKDSIYNLVVSNTEKISLRAKKRSNQTQIAFEREEVSANLRLQKITSLPNLGIFSDEAHHTYGNTFDRLKRVRETINYINSQRPIVAVVNTTGTPYYRRQMLKEVIFWYGLSDGIRDNILKDLKNGVHKYEIGEQDDQEVFRDIIEEFFDKYQNVRLPDGAKAKIAFYFKTQEHLEKSRTYIEKSVLDCGEDATQILVNTQKSNISEIDEFNRLNNPDNQKRIILLIGKGVEGWNCPSLFACALIKQQTSRNYVLQAATRCLRQVPENDYSAKIFLDSTNAQILDDQLQDNFRTDLGRLQLETKEKKIVSVHFPIKTLPTLELTRTVKRVVLKVSSKIEIQIKPPTGQNSDQIVRSEINLDFNSPGEILTPTGMFYELPSSDELVDCHAAAFKIASKYHLSFISILGNLKEIYPEGEIPKQDLNSLYKQVEVQTMDYEEVEEQVKEILALIRFKDENGNEVFEKDENNSYVHRLRMQLKTYEQMIENGLLVHNSEQNDKHGLTFHYTPYNFDSRPELYFFRRFLNILNENPEDIEVFLFTGGLTDPNKTDFHFEYLGEDKRYHRYYPDFVIVKKSGDFYIVEIKAENEKGSQNVNAKAKAIERLQKMQTHDFKYQIIYTSSSSMPIQELKELRKWIGIRGK